MEFQMASLVIFPGIFLYSCPGHVLQLEGQPVCLEATYHEKVTVGRTTVMRM
jgi:hypothetical protein